MNEGLVVAASAGMGDLGQRAEGERIGLVEAVAEWLAGQEGEVATTVLRA